MSNKRTHELLWLLAIVVTFFVVNCFSLHTGDDLGYMFADTTHHCGDGARVTSLQQCFTTQTHHYVTTNGRFLVHVVVMALLNLMPLWLYRVLNALMFGALWWLTTRFIDADKRSNSVYAAAWLLLLVAFPQPGLVLFTLVSYAVNYLWVGVAALAFLLMLKNKPQSLLTFICAFYVGTLQESYSLPLCAGLLVASLCKRVPFMVTLAFIVGTAIEVFAPGNMAHAAQGGGFTLTALCNKISALANDLTLSIITYAIIATAIWFACRKNECLQFLKENILLVVAIFAALGLAALSFTSPRQLTAPTIFTIILVLKLMPSRRAITIGATAAVVAVMMPMCVYKYQIYKRFNTFEQSVAQNKHLAFASGDAPCSINNYLTRAFIPDPLCNRGLVAVGDRYTKKGLERLRAEAFGDSVPLYNILPMAPHTIVSAIADKCHVENLDNTTKRVNTVKIGAFAMTALPRNVRNSYKFKDKISYEQFTRNDTTYLVLTANVDSLLLIKK